MSITKKTVSAAEIDKFQSILDEVVADATRKNILLYFTNPSWCPDCVEAEEPVAEYLESFEPEVKDRTTLIEVEVERSGYKAADAWETYLYRKV